MRQRAKGAIALEEYTLALSWGSIVSVTQSASRRFHQVSYSIGYDRYETFFGVIAHGFQRARACVAGAA
jgi:hypothetical protein